MNETRAITARLHNLSSKLSIGTNDSSRREALKLSKELTAELEVPENAALDLALGLGASPSSLPGKLSLSSHILATDICVCKNCRGFEPL